MVSPVPVNQSSRTALSVISRTSARRQEGFKLWLIAMSSSVTWIAAICVLPERLSDPAGLHRCQLAGAMTAEFPGRTAPEQRLPSIASRWAGCCRKSTARAVVILGPTACWCCNGELGEDVTETLEMIPR